MLVVDAAVTAASEVTELTAIANGAINFKFLGGLIVSIAASGQIIWVYIISYRSWFFLPSSVLDVDTWCTVYTFKL
jgi:hypothetical protein